MSKNPVGQHHNTFSWTTETGLTGSSGVTAPIGVSHASCDAKTLMPTLHNHRGAYCMCVSIITCSCEFRSFWMTELLIDHH